ncbi:MAG: hypothetical protein ACIALR_10330 [Blastopirellula sp. JB062]
MKPEPPAAPGSLGRLATAVVAIALFMGVGPGVLLANRPVMVLGLPLLYAWGIVWYFVLSAVAIVCYVWVWRDDPEDPQ